jgi:hypothetical protein
MSLAAASIALAGVQAFAQIRKGETQQAMFEGQARGLEVQAEFTRFSAKQESLKHKAAAVAELEKTLVNMAKINAAAGSGHIDPFSGNPFGLRTRALDVGGTNYAMADNNRAITVLLGEQQAQMQLFQASRARAAGKDAKSAGVMGALMTLGMSAFNFARVQAPGGNLGGANMFDPSGAGWSSQPYTGSNIAFS